MQEDETRSAPIEGAAPHTQFFLLKKKAAELQEVADAIVKSTEEKMGEVNEQDCLEYNGELIDAARMLDIVTSVLTEMSEAL